MKRYLAGFLSVVLLISLFPIGVLNVNAATYVNGGTTGDCYWEIVKGAGYELHISGIGDMGDYSGNSSPYTSPPYSYISTGGIYFQEIIIEDGVETIGQEAFTGCRFSSISIPDSVEKIERAAFMYTQGCEHITIPDSVTEIGAYAFAACDLTSVYFSSNVTSIGTRAFGEFTVAGDETPNGYMTPLETVWFGGSEEDAQKYSFSSSDMLACADWKYNVCSDFKHNYDNACDSTCNSCEYIRPIRGNHYYTNSCDSVCDECGYTRTPSHSYGNWQIRTAATCTQAGEQYRTCSACGVTQVQIIQATGHNYSNDICVACGADDLSVWEYTTIWGEEVMITGYTGLSTSVVIPSSIEGLPVTLIGSMAFFKTDITDIVIPNSVTNIGFAAFSDCLNLEKIIIPENVLVIGENAFFNCNNLTTIALPNSVCRIRDSAFKQCDNIKNVYYCGTANQFDEIAIESENECLILAQRYSHYYSEITTAPTCGGSGFTTHTCNICQDSYVDDYVDAVGHIFINGICTECGTRETPISDFEYTISGGYVTIDAYTGMSSRVVIPDTIAGNPVTKIGDKAFQNKGDISEIIIPNSVTIIAAYAFENCGITTVDMPPSITEIGYGAFRNCKELAAITLPENVNVLGDAAFAGCTNLINIEAHEDNTKFKSKDGVLFNEYGNGLICYPAGRSGDFEIPRGVIYIYPSAFEGCIALTGVYIPESVKFIKDNAFKLTGITEIAIPSSVVSLGEGAFEACKLTNITIPDSVTDIGDYIFQDCIALLRVDFLNNLDSISVGMFAGCTNLSDVFLPESVTNISQEAFKDCSSLVQVTIPTGVSEIRSSAFSGCTSLREITFSNCMTNIGFGAFDGCSNLEKICFCGEESDWEAIIISTYGNSAVTTANRYYHNYREVVTPPTCTEYGYTSYVCIYCEDSYISTERTEPACAFGSWKTRIAATCTANGEQYRTCSVCSNEETTALPATGHAYSAIVTNPTCTATGYTTHTCTCGYSYKDTFTDATGHNYSYKATKAPTVSSTGTLTGTCSKCSGTTTVTLPKLNTTNYTYEVTKSATCTTTGMGRYTWKTTTYGTFYFDVVISATGHSYVNKVTAPTCTAQGYTTHTCSCGYSYKDAYTNATGHSYSYKTTRAPTVSATGTLTGTCSKCSGTTSVTLPKLNTTNYTYGVTESATCTNIGTGRYTWKTTTYGTFYFDVVISATGHSYVNKVTAPTCTAQGYTTHTCSCGYSYKDTYTDATGHSYGSWKTRTAATCTASGEQYRTCSVCNNEETKVLSAMGHSYGNWQTQVLATCTTNGEEYHTCTSCGDQESRITTALGHILGDDNACDRCGYSAYIAGDLTGDDKINSLDGLLLMRYLNGWDVNIASPEAMDVNGDGKVNSLDGLILMRYLNGWNVTLG